VTGPTCSSTGPGPFLANGLRGSGPRGPGYSNNLPADVAKSLGARYIIAVDVATVEDTNYTNYGDSLSGWWLLWKRLPLPASIIGEPVHVPGMKDISSRLAYLTCEMQGRRVRKDLVDVYLKPRVAHISLLDFGAYETGIRKGYEAAVAKLGDGKERPGSH